MGHSKRMTDDNNSHLEVQEAELIKRAQSDPRDFADLYDLYAQRVFRYLLSKTGNQQDAEDLTTQTFMAALQSLPSYQHRGSFSAWLFSIARNKTNDHFRKQHKQISLEEAEGEKVDWGNPGILRDQTLDLSKLISRLPEDDQELLRLRFVAEMKFSEIAVLAKKSEDAVKKKIYRLLSWMENQLEDNNV